MSERDGTDDIEASRAQVLARRPSMVKALGTFVVAVCITFYFAEYIYAFLSQPLADALAGEVGYEVVFTDLQQAFFSYLTVALYVAFCVLWPLIVGSIWLRMSPNAYRNSPIQFSVLLAAAYGLFLLGVFLAFGNSLRAATLQSFNLPLEKDSAAFFVAHAAMLKEQLYSAVYYGLAFGTFFQTPVVPLAIRLHFRGVANNLIVEGGSR